jgi:prophage maintenance system killer protein
VDGKKRAGLASCLVFLEINGLLTDPDMPARKVDAWEAFVLDVAAGKLAREQTTRGLRKLLRKKRRDTASLPR